MQADTPRAVETVGAVVIGALAVLFWLVSRTLEGLLQFVVAVTAVAMAALAVALVMALLTEAVTDRHHVWVRNEPSGRPTRARYRCGLCGRREVEIGGVHLCPACDDIPALQGTRTR